MSRKRMDKQTVIHPHGGILPRDRNEGTADTYSNMDESQNHCAELKNTNTGDSDARLNLYESVKWDLWVQDSVHYSSMF